MKLHCLGTAGYHPSTTRHTSTYFLPECDLLLDAGTGVFRLLPLIEREEMCVLLSHAHLDHVVGLTYFLDLVSRSPLERIHLYGERSKLEGVKSHLFHPTLFPVHPPFVFHAWEDCGEEMRWGSVSCHRFPLEHPGGSVGYRLQLPEASLAYVTDTTSLADSDYWREIQGVDWLIHECNFPDSHRRLAEQTGHSWTSAVLENAYKHGIQRLVLTHVDPLADDSDPLGLDEAMRRLGHRVPSRTLLADDSLILDLSSL
jgi:ribonuclease BN (tRNA processing enzyme)